MVLEGIYTYFLNKYVNRYVENLGGKQLSVGIWGGIFYVFFYFLKN